MRVAANVDGTYSLSEIAGPVDVAESTLFRYRWQGRLLTAYDFSDEELKNRIMTCAIFGRELSGALPDARFDLEDCTRLRVIGSLGASRMGPPKAARCVLPWPWARAGPKDRAMDTRRAIPP